MAFSRAAQGERKLIRDQVFREEMAARGWCLVPLLVAMLEELRIPFEIRSDLTKSHRYSPLGTVYAPAWVYGVFLSAGAPASPLGNQMRWGILGMLLSATRDDEREQITVCGELALNIGVLRTIRDAARTYVDLLQRESDERGS